jgi:hypothetical protein
MTFSSILKTKISYLVISIFFILSIFPKLYWATFFWGFLLLLNLYFTYRTKKSILSNHDELVGEWNTDDGTGFYFAVMGYYLKFSDEGNGIYAYWSSDKEFDKEQEIEWQRIDEKTIKIKFSSDENWDIVSYEKEYINSKTLEIYEPNNDFSKHGKAFWKVYSTLRKKS